FHKNVVRRAMPFGTFTVKNLPLQLERLATRPGAFAAPFKPMVAGREPGDYIPDYLNNQFVMPLGPEQNGQRRFLSTLGLPQEEALKEFTLWDGKPDLLGSLTRMGGSLNPLLKYPIESATNTQLYSGRRLSDLHPSTTGRSIASLFNDQYAGPISQFVA